MPEEYGQQSDNRRRWLIIAAIILILLLILFLLWWFLWRERPVEEVIVTPEPTNSNQVTLPTLPPVEIEPEVVEPRFENAALVVARTFVERYGSYSNESNFQNVRDAFPLMTTSYRATFDVDSEAPLEESFGITTRALSVKLVEVAAGRIQATVSTQRLKRDQSLNTTVEYQDIILDMVESGDTWLVNNAQWQ